MSAVLPGPPAGPPTVVQTYTPMLVGAFLNTFLYGIAIVQMYTYYRTSKSDKLWMKLLVFYLFVMETANTIFDIGLVFEPLLLNFGNQSVRATSPWTLRLDGVVTALISTPVQMFMAWRIKVIMETVIPSVIIVMVAISSLVGSIWLAIEVTAKPNFIQFDDFRGAPALWLISSAIADVLIAICLVYGLSKKRTGFAVLNDQIDRIIRVTVQTGSLTAITALADAIVFLSVPHTTVFFAWDLMLSKMYTTTLLSSLNARAVARREERDNAAGPNALFSSELSSSNNNPTLTFNSSRVSRYVPQAPGPKLSTDYSNAFEMSNRAPNQRRGPGLHTNGAMSDFSVTVTESTVNDAGQPIYPPTKPLAF